MADQVAEALTKIEARPDWVEATYPDNFVLLHKREAAALVEVAKAADNGLFECENMESGEPWYKWLRAALDALTKAVE